ncbi:MAG: glucose-6-phosphate isomerase family protein [Nanoarchaeota archaeon]
MKKEYKKIANQLRKNYDEKVVRTLKDMRTRYHDQKEVKKILKKKNPVIYRVYIGSSRIKTARNLRVGLTVLNSGCIGKEYYMTKGHEHKKKIPEKYILIQGKGKLILQRNSNKNNKTIIKNLKKNKIYEIPGDAAHRIVNTGNKKLEVLSFYDKRAGHSYKIEFKERLFKLDKKV